MNCKSVSNQLRAVQYGRMQIIRKAGILPTMDLVASLRMAARNLLRNTRRTAVAVLTVAAGIAAYLLAGGFIEYIFHEMREATIHAHLGHLQVVRPGYWEKGLSDPFSYLLPNEAEKQAAVEQAIRPVTMAPRLAFGGLVSLGDLTFPFVAEGVAPAKESAASSRMNIMRGRHLSESDSMAVMLGEGLAGALGASVGDRVVLLVTRKDGAPNAVELSVVGIFSTSSKDFDDYALRLPISSARALMRVDGATSWVLLLERTEDTEAAAASLRGTLPEDRFQVVPWTELADFYNKTVVLFSKQVDVLKFIIAFIIVLTIINIQTMTVLERTTEIGTALAIGSSRQSIMKGFVVEGAVIGAVGGVLGLLLGWLLASAISIVGIPMPAPPGMARGYIGRILLTPDLMFGGLALGVATSLLASILPAWKAGRMNIVDALRYGQ